jgi:hypothetical protein
VSDAGTGPVRLEVIALDDIPEVHPGDDLASLIGDALAATPGALPLRHDDVLVVTQKVVSKAEGALADLATIERRPEAIAYAARWGRDARQVEVVLRQAVRVVRMDLGVVIVETRHGFVLANGGRSPNLPVPGSLCRQSFYSRSGTRPTAEGEITIAMPQVRDTLTRFVSSVIPDTRAIVRTRPLEALVIGAFAVRQAPDVRNP